VIFTLEICPRGKKTMILDETRAYSMSGQVNDFESHGCSFFLRRRLGSTRL
jgi:hypothetical protein